MAQIGETTLFNDANFIAYHKGEDVSDSKGAFTLTNNASVTFTPGKYANGFNLGSGNSSKYLSNVGNLGITGGAISITMWVKLIDEIASSSWYLGSQIDGGNFVGNFIRYDYNSGTQRLAFQRLRANVSADEVTSTTTLGTSAFHFIVYTFDGSTVKGYIDNGSPVTVASSGNGASGVSSEYQIGARTGSGFASAIIDDVGVFSRALTATEIDTLFRDGHFMRTGKNW